MDGAVAARAGQGIARLRAAGTRTRSRWRSRPARDALRRRRRQPGSSRCCFATTHAPYADLQSSRDRRGRARSARRTSRSCDIGNSQRAGTSGLLQALRGGAREHCSSPPTRRVGKPASTQEMTYGAGAAAFVLGRENVIATLAGSAQRDRQFRRSFPRRRRALRLFLGRALDPRRGLSQARARRRSRRRSTRRGWASATSPHFVMPSLLRGGAQAVAKAIGLHRQRDRSRPRRRLRLCRRGARAADAGQRARTGQARRAASWWSASARAPTRWCFAVTDAIATCRRVAASRRDRRGKRDRQLSADAVLRRRRSISNGACASEKNAQDRAHRAVSLRRPDRGVQGRQMRARAARCSSRNSNIA